MSGSTVLSVRISAETKAKLDALAVHRRRSRSFLTAEAVEAYVAREIDHMGKIEEGLEDARNGDLVSHQEAMTRIHATIERVGRDGS